MLLTEGHHKRGLALERLVAVAATNPARIMGLGHAKGRVEPGLDADLALVDLNIEWTLHRDDVVSSAGYSIYEATRFKGRVRHAFVRGRAILRDDAWSTTRSGVAAMFDVGSRREQSGKGHTAS